MALVITAHEVQWRIMRVVMTGEGALPPFPKNLIHLANRSAIDDRPQTPPGLSGGRRSAAYSHPSLETGGPPGNTLDGYPAA